MGQLREALETLTQTGIMYDCPRDASILLDDVTQTVVKRTEFTMGLGYLYQLIPYELWPFDYTVLYF